MRPGGLLHLCIARFLLERAIDGGLMNAVPVKGKGNPLLLACVLAGSLGAKQSPGCEVAFKAEPIFTVGRNAGANALADLDGDGNLDLTTGPFFFLGNGDGSFGPARPVMDQEPAPLFDIVPRDFDSDGRLDLALGSIVGPFLYVSFGRAPETPDGRFFEEYLEIPSVEGPWHLAPADFNEDGLPDFVAVSRREIGNPFLVLNNGDRTFKTVENPQPSSLAGHALTVGDFDGDTHIDIIQGVGFQAMLLFGNGNATFDPPVTSTIRHELKRISAHRFRSADLDQDGRSDLGVIGEGFVLVYLGCELARGQDLPVQASVALSLAGSGRFMEFSDINSDGAVDVVAQSNRSGNAVVEVFYADQVSPCNVSFVAGESLLTPLDGHGSVLAVGDVNGDFAPDVVLTTETDGKGQVFLNDASCSLREAMPGDCNVDGRVDISDAVAALSYLFVGADLKCPPAAEVSGDGNLNISDAIYLLQYLFASGPPIPDTGPVDCL